jgi:amino acid permease
MSGILDKILYYLNTLFFDHSIHTTNKFEKNAIIEPFKIRFIGDGYKNTWNQFYNGYPTTPNVNNGINNLSMAYNQMLYQYSINNKQEKDIEDLNYNIFKLHLMYIFIPIILLIMSLIGIIIYDIFTNSNNSNNIKNIKDNYIGICIFSSVFWVSFYCYFIMPYINLNRKNKELFKIHIKDYSKSI